MLSPASRILGINARNLLYVKPLNPKKAVSFAKDKLHTKLFLGSRGIPVSKLYATIKTVHDLDKFSWDSLPKRFVLKPNLGSGGKGVLLLEKAARGNFQTIDGKIMPITEAVNHVIDILDGNFTTSSAPDIALFEETLKAHKELREFAPIGLPDIRVIVFNLIPVMAQLRLPTPMSKGRANLHAGGVSVGIDINKGKCTYILHRNQIVKKIPGVDKGIRGFKIPFWDDILHLASKTQFITNVGYLACDIAIDEKKGPTIIEINSHGGLAIQLANLAPLRSRLNKAADLKVLNPEKAVQIAKDLFAEKKQTHLATPSKPILGNLEIAKIIRPDGSLQELPVKVTPTKDKTIIDIKFTKALGFDLKNKQEEDTIPIKVILGRQRLSCQATLRNLDEKEYRINFGKREVVGFLYDPEKKPAWQEHREQSLTGTKKINYKQVDANICAIDEKIKLLYHLRPVNLAEEKTKFFSDQKSYNPKFIYPELKFNPDKLRRQLREIKTDDNPLGKIFEKKRREIMRKIDLLTARGKEEFTEKSVQLYGKPDSKLVEQAKAILSQAPKEIIRKGNGKLTSQEVKKKIEQVLRRYSLKWEVKIRKDLISGCTTNKNKAILVKDGMMFSPDRVEALIVHEIETHLLTAENGSDQPYKIFQRGTAGYMTTQEGLACYNQEKYAHDKHKKFLIARNVLAVDKMFSASFNELFWFVRDMGFNNAQAWGIAIRIKRGLTDTSKAGGFTKECIYLKGKISIEDFIKNGGSLEKLYIGKINISDLDVIEQIEDLHKPKKLPKFLL